MVSCVPGYDGLFMEDTAMSGMTSLFSRAPSSRVSSLQRKVPSRHIKVNEAARLESPLALVCGLCGTKGKYYVGTVIINPEVVRSDARNAIEQAVGFSGYFRCKKCNGGGPWLLPDRTLAFITLMMMESMNDAEDIPLIFGSSATFDKRAFRYATECEAHLKSLIEKEPQRAFLWVRLGNLYSHARMHDQAQAAYVRAIELDPSDIEAHAMFGYVLVETNRAMEAVPHWHAVLKNARDAKQVNRDLRRKLARSAIESLLDAHAQSNGMVDLFPKVDPEERAANRDSNEPVVLHLREFDLGSEEGVDELCEFFLEPPRRGWRDLHGRNKKRLAEDPHDWTVEPIRRNAEPVPRNNPCPCGSGHKYKKCCGR